MGRRRCCCEGECIIFEDNFDPPCTGTIDGTNWDVVTGTAIVVDPNADDCATDGQYLEVSAGGVVVCKNDAPDYEYIVTVQLVGDAGQHPRVLVDVDYNEGAGTVSSYKFVEFDIDDDEIRFGSHNGSDTIHYIHSGAGLGSNSNVSVYWNLATLSAGIDGDCLYQGAWYCFNQYTGNKYFGLGASSAGVGQFQGGTQKVVFEQHTDAYDTCGDCDCMCEDVCVSRELQGVMTLVDSDDSCCENDVDEGDLTFAFEYDITDDDTACSWEGLPSLDYCGSYNHEFKLTRSTDSRNVPCTDYLLQDNGYPGWDGGGAISPTVCTCDPFYLKYEFTTEYPGSGACSWELEITEVP